MTINALPVEIATQATAGKRQFEIRLDPPELGRVEVKMNIDNNGNTTTRLVVDRPETLDLLKRDSSQLERALQDAGLKTSDNGLEFSLRQQSAQGDDQGSSKGTTLAVPSAALTVQTCLKSSMTPTARSRSASTPLAPPTACASPSAGSTARSLALPCCAT